MKSRTRRICSVAMLATLACAMAPALPAETPPCPVGTDVLAEYRLFFGRSQGTVEVVTDEAWQAFLAAEITPRFPDGLTVLDAAGQWRDATGTIVRERSKLVIILAEPGASGMQRTDQAHLRPGIRSACDHDRLRIVLAAPSTGHVVLNADCVYIFVYASQQPRHCQASQGRRLRAGEHQGVTPQV